jgi:hypothetical protein
VTTDNTTDLTDQITQDQQVLDQQQGVTDDLNQAGPTNQQLMDRLEATDRQVASLMQQNRGLQSLIDGGLNAIRKDSEAWMDSQMSNLRGEQNREKVLAGLEEDQRALAEAVFGEMDRRMPSQVAPDAAPNTTGQNQLAQQWEPVLQYAETLGITRNDTRIQWNLLAGAGNQVDTNKWPAFRDHLVALRAHDLNPQQSAPSSQNGDAPVQQRPATPNPPVESSSQLPLGNLRTEDDIRDAFIQGRFNSSEDPNGMNEYTKRLSSIGVTV